MGLTRGQVVTAAPPGSFGKPRPALVIQAQLRSEETITLALITSDLEQFQALRVPVMPTATSGLRHPSEIMTDMIHTLPVGKVGKVIGVLDAATLLQVDAALKLHLGLR